MLKIIVCNYLIKLLAENLYNDHSNSKPIIHSELKSNYYYIALYRIIILCIFCLLLFCFYSNQMFQLNVTKLVIYKSC